MKRIREGYTRLPNSLLQVLCFVTLKPAVLKTFLSIYRLTLGWGIPERVLSYNNIGLMTGLRKADQYRAVKEALKLGIIKRYDIRAESEVKTEKPRYCYSAVPDAREWKVEVKNRPWHFVRLWKKVSVIHQTYESVKQQTGKSVKQQTTTIDLLIDNQIK